MGELVSAPRRGSELGVAIAARRLVVVDPRVRRGTPAAQPFERALEPMGDGAEWPALVDALRELRDARGVAGELAIALLAPLADVRPLALPPLPADELRRLVARSASRYFLGAREPQVVAILPRRTRGEQAPVLAAAADARRLDAIYAAAARSGWSIRTIVPAETAWRGAALARWTTLARGTHDVAIAHPDRVDVLQLSDGRLRGVRRLRRADATLGEVPHVLGAPDADPAELAATYAARGAGLELVPEHAWRIRRARLWRATAGVAAAAVLLLVLAGGLQAAALRRELAAVRAERARLRPQVASVLATQELLGATARRFGELAAAPRRAARWSTVLETLSEYLPENAYLTSLTGHVDTLVVEGVTETSGDVFDALSEARTLANVRAVAPVRRDFRAADDAAEHFAIGARVVGVESVPKAPARPAPRAGPAAAAGRP